jgi:hypothetical protein
MEQSPSWEAGNRLLVKKWLTFYGTRSFITVVKRARNWNRSWATWTRSTPSHSIPLRSTLILSSHLISTSQLDSSLPVFRLKFCTHLIIDACYMFCPSHHLNNIKRKVQVKTLLICNFLHPPRTSVFGSKVLLRTLFSNTPKLILWWKGPYIKDWTCFS